MPKEKSGENSLYDKIQLLAFYFTVVAIFAKNKIHCIFRTFLGIPCPGCGMTRAIKCLLKFNFSVAAKYNFMVFSIPLLLLYYFSDGKLFGKKADRIILSAIAAGFIINWVYHLVIRTGYIL